MMKNFVKVLEVFLSIHFVYFEKQKDLTDGRSAAAATSARTLAVASLDVGFLADSVMVDHCWRSSWA